MLSTMTFITITEPAAAQTRAITIKFADKNFEVVINSQDFDLPTIFTTPNKTCTERTYPTINAHRVHSFITKTICNPTPNPILKLSFEPTNYRLTLNNGDTISWKNANWASYKKTFPVYAFVGTNKAIIIHYDPVHQAIPTSIETVSNNDVEFYISQS
jgi:hypothetical protein